MFECSMADVDSHREIIGRWLRGEVVHGEVGVRLRGGPSDGKIKIVSRGDDGRPPHGLRTRRGLGSWHLYLPAAEAAEMSGWIYLYAGEEELVAR